MDAKAPSSSYHTHIETRLNYETIPGPIICIQLPSTGTFARSSKSSRKVISALPNSQNEEEYRYRRIASSSGIHFRSRKRYPRSILWRCLENNKVVEVRSLDLSKSHDEPEDKEANLVLRIGFPSQIARDGVAFADSDTDDSISLFVLTTSNELYTITLKSVLFYKATASEDDFDRFVKIFKPASLSITSAFRLKAANAQELFIGLADGRLLRLARKAGQDGSEWNETAYSDGQWGSSLRGLIRWSAGSNTVNFEGTTLDHNTALDMSLLPGQTHLICVGLNHTLKIWNLQTGRANITRDILDIERESSEIPKVLIHPSNSNVLDVFECLSGFDGDLYYLVTFSPHSSGVFKFWGMRDPDNAEHGIRDLFEDDILRAPEPDDGAVWMMADFKIQTETRSSTIDVWITMKLNKRYKIYRRRFLDLQSLGREWDDGWSVIVDAVKKESTDVIPSRFSDGEAKSIPERWLDYILMPGRFAEATLETALVMYIEARRLQPQRNNRLPLKDRISSVIGSSTYLSSSQTDTAIDDFQEQLSNEWTVFWKIVADIDQAHWESATLGFDHLEDTPYTVFGGGFATVRDLSELESIAYNTPEDLATNQTLSLTQSIEADPQTDASSTPDELAIVVEAAAKFRSSFSPNLKASASYALQEQLWKDPDWAVPELLQRFYTVCDFESEISDRVYDDVVSGLKPHEGLSVLRTSVVQAILDSLSDELPSESEQRNITNAGTQTGGKILGQGIKDLLAVQERILIDLFYLLVFLTIEADQEFLPDHQLDSNKLYLDIVDRLKQVQIVKWLAANTISVPVSQAGGSTTLSNHTSSRVSSLEQEFIKRFSPRAAISQSQSAALTQSIRGVLTFVCGGNTVSLDDILFNIQCVFLKDHDLDSASSFSQFQSSTAWGTYVKGRLHLAKQEYTEATLCFKKAAVGLARDNSKSTNPHLRSSGYIKTTEMESFGTGAANYYAHVMSLFPSSQAHGQILSLAELTLQHCPASNVAQRSDILERLFRASVAIMEYSTAYAALVRYTDKALQKSALTELIRAMVSNGYVEELLSLPLTTLKKDVEKILLEKAEQEVGLPINATPRVPYFKVLYAFHIRHKNYRAAASVLISRLEARHARRSANAKQNRFLNSKQEAEKALDEYLVGINALALLSPEDDEDDEDEAWVFVEDGASGQGGSKKRRVMRIEGLRERYQSEMDRIEAIEFGRYGVIDDDEEDEDEMDGVEPTGTLLTA